ncbi:hypothetical protein BH09SUM1_BH09SUM1_26810 [soil metagenome]
MLQTLALSMPQGAEWIFILLIVVIIFGAKSLPKLGRSLGTGIREFKDATKKGLDDDDDDPPEVMPRRKSSSSETREVERKNIE